MPVNWRIYYAGGETYSDLDGPWELAPATGVVVVVVRDPTGVWGRWVHSGYVPPSPVGYPRGNEFFVKRPAEAEPWATNELGLRLFRREGWPEENIKYGAMVPQEEWQAIQAAAVADPDFPRGTPRRRASDFEPPTDNQRIR